VLDKGFTVSTLDIERGIQFPELPQAVKIPSTVSSCTYGSAFNTSIRFVWCDFAVGINEAHAWDVDQVDPEQMTS
jgi:hypothetical protein